MLLFHGISFFKLKFFKEVVVAKFFFKYVDQYNFFNFFKSTNLEYLASTS